MSPPEIAMSLHSPIRMLPSPFWFGHEEPNHVESIIETYSKFLQLNKDRDKSSREPSCFVGGVFRVTDQRLPAEQAVRRCFKDKCGLPPRDIALAFVTFDTVNTYLNELYEFEGLPCGYPVKYVDESRSALRSAALPCPALLCSPLHCPAVPSDLASPALHCPTTSHTLR